MKTVLLGMIVIGLLCIGGFALYRNQVQATAKTQASLPVSAQEKRPSVITLQVETSTTFVDSPEQTK